MNKTMLAALIVGASALSVPALAQVNLGGGAQVGAAANTGAVVPGAVHAVDQTGSQATQAVHRADSKARHISHRAADRTRSTMDRDGKADAHVGMSGSVDAGKGNPHAGAHAGTRVDASVDAGATSGEAIQAGQEAGERASDATHSALRRTGEQAGSVRNTLSPPAGAEPVDADAAAKARVKASAQGH